MGCRRMYLLWDRSLISRFFAYKYVHAWRTVYAVFYMAGTADRMAGCSAKTDYTLYDLCCEYGIYHWNYRKQMVSPGSLGLFGYAIAVMGADLPSLCAYFFFFMYYGYPSVRISAPLVL